MDIIYHRNCLDGVFSAHLFYLASRVLTSQHLDSFLQTFIGRIESKKPFESIEQTQSYQNVIDLTPEVLTVFQATETMIAEEKQLQFKKYQINQDFFHQSQLGVSYYAYSIFAGEFFPFKFPSNNKILFILDTNLVSAQNIASISQKYEAVFLIDHHTSFQPIKKDILLQKTKLRKLFYLFSENYCASQLCYMFLQKYFCFSKFFEENHFANLRKMLGYVGANDRKHKQSKQSKKFVLGFYYFDIELSHLNPMLNKRIGMINLEYLMEKGSNLYISHMNQIAKEIRSAMICRLQISGKLKGKTCYCLKPSNLGKMSDIGIVLAYLSKSHGMENLAVMYSESKDLMRISTRSNKGLDGALALQLAQKYQGGGHLCAAGFKLSMQKFRSQFSRLGCDKKRLEISGEQVEKILLNEWMVEKKQK